MGILFTCQTGFFKGIVKHLQHSHVCPFCSERYWKKYQLEHVYDPEKDTVQYLNVIAFLEIHTGSMAGATVISDKRPTKAQNFEDTALFPQQVTLDLISGSTHQTVDEERRESVWACVHTLSNTLECLRSHVPSGWKHSKEGQGQEWNPTDVPYCFCLTAPSEMHAILWHLLQALSGSAFPLKTNP